MSAVSTLILIGRNKYLLYSTLIIKYAFFLLLLYINNRIFGIQFIMIPIALYILDEYSRTFINFLGIKNKVKFKESKNIQGMQDNNIKLNGYVLISKVYNGEQRENIKVCD